MPKQKMRGHQIRMPDELWARLCARIEADHRSDYIRRAIDEALRRDELAERLQDHEARLRRLEGRNDGE